MRQVKPDTTAKLFETAPQAAQKSPYCSPRLTVFGKIQAIVAAGSGLMMEGVAMVSMTRRP